MIKRATHAGPARRAGAAGRVGASERLGLATGGGVPPRADLNVALGPKFFDRPTPRVARDLLGKILAHRIGRKTFYGRIVETEAYHGMTDRACHAHKGRTPRTAPMFGPPGHANVYQIYGMWFCLNAVTMRDDFPAAVLVRAVAPIESLPWPDDAARAGSGPGKLCRLFQIDKRETGRPLVPDTGLWITDDSLRVPPRHVAKGPRVGVGYAGDHALRPWRFWWNGHSDVSRG